MAKIKRASESMVGIRGYLTRSVGVGGRLRDSPEDFIVEEILTDGGIVRIGSGLEDHLQRDVPGGRFCHFAMEKRGIDLFGAIERLSRGLAVSRKRFSYCGTKDARALTSQLMSVEGMEPDDLDVQIDRLWIRTPFRAGDGLFLGGHWGNAFRIRVKGIGLERSVLDHVTRETVTEISKHGGVPNFFGHQRFGTTRCNTHLVGKHLLAGHFESAVWEYLGSPFEGEGEDALASRLELTETGDLSKALTSFPRRLNYERKMLQHLSQHPHDYLGALRRLPRNLLSIFVRAYQSYLFNLTLSRRILLEDPFLPRDGDVIERGEERLLVGEGIPLKDAVLLENAGKAKVVYPVVGYASKVDGPVCREASETLEQEGIRNSFFYCRQLPDISPRGGYRDILCPVQDLSVQLPDSPEGGSSLELSFKLRRGSYATVVLREFMKAGIKAY